MYCLVIQRVLFRISTAAGTSVDTGESVPDPTDDKVVTPATAACSSCHDSQVATAHMESNGGSFSTTQAAIDNGQIVEQCELCHGSGKTSDVSLVHGIRELP